MSEPQLLYAVTEALCEDEPSTLLMPHESAYVTETATGLTFHPETPLEVVGPLIERLTRQHKRIEWASECGKIVGRKSPRGVGAMMWVGGADNTPTRDTEGGHLRCGLILPCLLPARSHPGLNVESDGLSAAGHSIRLPILLLAPEQRQRGLDRGQRPPTQRSGQSLTPSSLSAAVLTAGTRHIPPLWTSIISPASRRCATSLKCQTTRGGMSFSQKSRNVRWSALTVTASGRWSAEGAEGASSDAHHAREREAKAASV